jgi:anthranilate/para-aminobenzoate synthase component II
MNSSNPIVESNPSPVVTATAYNSEISKLKKQRDWHLEQGDISQVQGIVKNIENEFAKFEGYNDELRRKNYHSWSINLEEMFSYLLTELWRFDDDDDLSDGKVGVDTPSSVEIAEPSSVAKAEKKRGEFTFSVPHPSGGLNPFSLPQSDTQRAMRKPKLRQQPRSSIVPRRDGGSRSDIQSTSITASQPTPQSVQESAVKKPDASSLGTGKDSQNVASPIQGSGIMGPTNSGPAAPAVQQASFVCGAPVSAPGMETQNVASSNQRSSVAAPAPGPSSSVPPTQGLLSDHSARQGSGSRIQPQSGMQPTAVASSLLSGNDKDGCSSAEVQSGEGIPAPPKVQPQQGLQPMASSFQPTAANAGDTASGKPQVVLPQAKNDLTFSGVLSELNCTRDQTLCLAPAPVPSPLQSQAASTANPVAQPTLGSGKDMGMIGLARSKQAMGAPTVPPSIALPQRLQWWPQSWAPFVPPRPTQQLANMGDSMQLDFVDAMDTLADSFALMGVQSVPSIVFQQQPMQAPSAGDTAMADADSSSGDTDMADYAEEEDVDMEDSSSEDSPMLPSQPPQMPAILQWEAVQQRYPQIAGDAMWFRRARQAQRAFR